MSMRAHIAKTGSAVALLAVIWSVQTSPAAVECRLDQAVIDGTIVKYGAPVAIVGRCQEKHWGDLSPSQADLELIRINGRGNQDHIIVHLTGLPHSLALKPGDWYDAYGTISDGNASGPPPALSMSVDKIDPVHPAALTPNDFIGREADFEGTAADGGVLQLETGTIRVTPWPATVIGKRIGVHGVVKKDAAGFVMPAADWHLLDLADMADTTVSLDGSFWSLNGVWWFSYRDSRMVVTDSKDTPVLLDSGRHGSRARVTGLLVNQLRPSLEQISLKTDRDLIPTFVLRRAKIEFIEPPLDEVERFREVYPGNYKITDGVPELQAQDVRRRNIMGDETEAGGFVQFNIRVINSILASATPATLDVLAHRMNDGAVNPALRLVYASMLATANDPRGRAELTAAAGRRDADFNSTLFCLGAFAALAPDDAKVRPEIAWVEPLLIQLMTEKDARGKYTTAPAAVLYSRIPSVLARSSTPAARQALIDYAVANPDQPIGFIDNYNVLRIFAAVGMPVSHADLLRLESVSKDADNRRCVLHIALRENDAVAAALFFNELGNEDNWFESEFGDHPTPEMVASLATHLKGVSPRAAPVVRGLIILGEKDPVSGLLKLLDDPTWTDKNWVMWRLMQTTDPRIVAPAFRVLRNGPADYFHADDNMAGYGVTHSIATIAAPGTKESISDLIDLLDVDLTPFSKSYDREGYRRIVAAHLIELTGESFGTDSAAWRRWQSGH
jgi:hypothetical protein